MRETVFSTMVVLFKVTQNVDDNFGGPVVGRVGWSTSLGWDLSFPWKFRWSWLIESDNWWAWIIASQRKLNRWNTSLRSDTVTQWQIPPPQWAVVTPTSKKGRDYNSRTTEHTLHQKREASRKLWSFNQGSIMLRTLATSYIVNNYINRIISERRECYLKDCRYVDMKNSCFALPSQYQCSAFYNMEVPWSLSYLTLCMEILSELSQKRKGKAEEGQGERTYRDTPIERSPKTRFAVSPCHGFPCLASRSATMRSGFTPFSTKKRWFVL